MPLYEFWCPKCKKFYDRFCSYKDIGNQKCDKCGELLKRSYSSITFFVPSYFNPLPQNDPDILKPRTNLEQKKYREFMENSQPISQSTI